MIDDSNNARVRLLEEKIDKLPPKLWLAMADDLLSTILPTDSKLLGQIRAISNESEPIQLRAIMEAIKGLTTFQPLPDTLNARIRAELQREMARALEAAASEKEYRELAFHGFQERIDKAIDVSLTNRLPKHFMFKLLGAILLSLVGALAGIDVWYAKMASAAQENINRMQQKVDGARVVIFEKEAELDKSLLDAKTTLVKSRDAATEALKDDLKNARTDITTVKGNITEQIRTDAKGSFDAIKVEEKKQIADLRLQAAIKIGDIKKPYVIWLLGASWLLPVAAFVCSLVAIGIVFWGRKRIPR